MLDMQIEGEMQRVAKLAEQAAHLQQTVSGQRRQMGGLDAATKEENQVGLGAIWRCQEL